MVRKGGSRTAAYCCIGCALLNSMIQMDSRTLHCLHIGSSSQRHSSVARIMENLAWPRIQRQCEEVKCSKAKGVEDCSLLPQLLLTSHFWRGKYQGSE